MSSDLPAAVNAQHADAMSTFFERLRESERFHMGIGDSPEPAEASNLIDGVRMNTPPRLIELTLASGITNPDRLKDLADVQDLILHLSLDETFASRLDPFVRELFLELVHEVKTDRRPEE